MTRTKMLVKIGSHVVVEANGTRDEFILQEADKVGYENGFISVNSKVGKALLGKAVGHSIQVSSVFPVVYKILEIN
ncbi:MAG: GreA/GreB family elongation factor [bacterium]|nr:GreA/GreB family elongation factor [bacterium]